MARRTLNDGEELIFQDINDLQALKEQELYDRVLFEMLQRVENSFFQDGFKVIFVDDIHLSVNAGLGIQTNSTVANTEPQKRLIYSSVPQSLTIADPDTANDRIDLVVVKSARAVTETDTRKYKATIGGSVTTTTFNVRDDWSSDLQIVTGTPSGSPVAPAVPSGYLLLAQIHVHAVTGIGSQGDFTDERTMMPVGGNVAVNTTGYQRIPAGAATSLTTITSAIDALLKQGYQNYTDFDNLGSDPAAPTTGKVRVYLKGGVAFLLPSGGSPTPLGSGGGGGGGADWAAADGTSPLLDTDETGAKVWRFGAGLSQKLSLFIKVPQSYISGRQINLYLTQYSGSTSGTQLLQTTSSLIRAGVDAATSTANQRTSGNAAITNTSPADLSHQTELDLTDATGKINGFSVSPGDMLRVDLVRGTDTDTDDIRFIPSSTEVTFS